MSDRTAGDRGSPARSRSSPAATAASARRARRRSSRSGATVVVAGRDAAQGAGARRDARASGRQQRGVRRARRGVDPRRRRRGRRASRRHRLPRQLRRHAADRAAGRRDRGGVRPRARRQPQGARCSSRRRWPACRSPRRAAAATCTCCRCARSSACATAATRRTAAARAASRCSCRQHAVELARHGINVNGVAPTVVRTRDGVRLASDPELYRQLIERIPLGRIAEVDDVSGPVLFFLGAASALRHRPDSLRRRRHHGDAVARVSAGARATCASASVSVRRLPLPRACVVRRACQKR